MKPELGPQNTTNHQELSTLVEVDQRPLTITFLDEEISIKNQEKYGNKDIASACHIGPSTVNTKLMSARRFNPSLVENFNDLKPGQRGHSISQLSFINYVVTIRMIPDGRIDRAESFMPPYKIISLDDTNPENQVIYSTANTQETEEMVVFVKNLYDPEKDEAKKDAEKKKVLEILSEEQIQIYNKASLYMLAKLSEKTNQNVRVILGGSMSPRIPLLDVLGPATDEELKGNLIKNTKQNLLTYWHKKPSDIDSDISEKQRQEQMEFIFECQKLKQQGQNPEGITDIIGKKIVVYPPYDP